MKKGAGKYVTAEKQLNMRKEVLLYIQK